MSDTVTKPCCYPWLPHDHGNSHPQSGTLNSLFFKLSRSSSIRHLLFTGAAKILVLAFVLSRLDYCNYLLCLSLVSPKQPLQQFKTALLALWLEFPRLTMHVPHHLACFSPLAVHWLTNTVQTDRFIVLPRLKCLLWLDKGDFPENMHTVCPC